MCVWVPYGLRPEQRVQGCGSKIEVKSRRCELSLSTSTAGTGVNGDFPSTIEGTGAWIIIYSVMSVWILYVYSCLYVHVNL